MQKDNHTRPFDLLKGASNCRLFEQVEELLIARAVRQAGDNCDNADELWARGFLPSSGTIYDFTEFPIKDYLSDLQREMTRGIDGPWAALLHDKVVFAQIYGSVVSTPRIAAYTSHNSLVGELSLGLRFFAKPAQGGGGIGVIKGEVTRSGILVGDESYSYGDFERLLLGQTGVRKHYIVTEAVVPHGLISSFYPHTVNTIRILMMRDRQGVFIAAAVLRVGCKNSGNVDNFSRGGISFPIDISTGRIGTGLRKNRQAALVHPDTGTQIAGKFVPHWDETLSEARKAMQHIPALSYVGWDIVVSSNGPVFLEGNHFSDVNLLQVHGPLLDNDRVRAFYESKGILSYKPKAPLRRLDAESLRGLGRDIEHNNSGGKGLI